MALEWDYNKLPDDQLLLVEESLRTNDESTLVQLHNKYGLSGRIYCCSGQGVMEHFKQLLHDRTGKEE